MNSINHILVLAVGILISPTCTHAWQTTETPSDPIAGREHWAFQPLSAQTLPLVQQREWPKTPIDAYILAKLESNKLVPAPGSDPRTLVCRLYIQLIGLPPTPEQVAEFLANDRPNAVEQLVDQLLGSPQFGERWGRHWLDLARYADSNGMDENFLFREAWRYRNLVTQAFNSDTAFDRFLLEQIAGDLLPHKSIEQRDRQRIASGFLVIGPKVLLGNDSKERRMDIADEQLDTIGRTVLGQTLGCARCHDHKFDPIPTADYYALAGIFTSTRVMETRHMLGQQRLMEQLIGLGSRGDNADNDYEKYWRERPTLQEKVKHARAALELLKKGDEEAFEAHVKDHSDTVADEARDQSMTKDVRRHAQEAFLKPLAARLAKPPEIPPRAMISNDEDHPADEHIRIAGQFDRLGEKIPRGFLRVISDHNAKIPEGKSGRVQLARWLTDTNSGAGHLSARVFVNRIWHHLIGRGIVRTVDNFGRTGEPPTHPKLLDYLARELVKSGWSTKSLIREIVLSRTFAISSRHDVVGHSIDPENRLLWRANRRQIDPETMRDAMLQAAGTLNRTPMDSTVWYLGDQATAVGNNKNRRRTDFHCRSLYLPVIRNDLPELFEVFDFADPHSTTGMRDATTVPTQGLFLLNDESVMAAAEATARRILADKNIEDESRVINLFELVLTTRASATERRELLNFVNEVRHRLGPDDSEEANVRAWSMACHALFASSRFQTVD